MVYTRDVLLEVRENKNSVSLDWNTLLNVRNEGLTTTTNREKIGTQIGDNI